MCIDYEIPEKKNQKNKFALDNEDLQQVEPELEQAGAASSDFNKLDICNKRIYYLFFLPI